MIKASHKRTGAWLRMLCTSARESGFENCWKYVCVKTGLNQSINGRGGLESPAFLNPIVRFTGEKE
ncbi:hypothetical protein [Lacrimispora celerecrescens]|uniref:hypothetical protein n=1 Tax=Lacrimispora celerecrescens TaxID=29354 RepID=UPI000C24A3B4|nr:hypothetical protein [Lacrimispora celerecrescens]